MSINKNQPDTRYPKTKKVKVYSALISQTGTDAPVVIVLQNTLGEDLVWTRAGVGQYVGTSTGVFTAEKTWGIISNQSSSYLSQVQIVRTGDIAIEVRTLYNDVQGDGLIAGNCLEVRVYE